MSFLYVVGAAWLIVSAVFTVVWCVSISLYGSRDCNPPALRVARTARAQAGHEFVAAHMSRYPVRP